MAKVSDMKMTLTVKLKPRLKVYTNIILFLYTIRLNSLANKCYESLICDIEADVSKYIDIKG